jgi:putative transposase
MRKSRFSESQIVAILNEHDAGVPTAELARKHGIHANTLRLWKAKYGGMDAAELAFEAARRRKHANASDYRESNSRD